MKKDHENTQNKHALSLEIHRFARHLTDMFFEGLKMPICLKQV